MSLLAAAKLLVPALAPAPALVLVPLLEGMREVPGMLHNRGNCSTWGRKQATEKTKTA
jgi:hypothetical protein